MLAFIDVDSMQKRVYGHAKQGAAFGHTKIQGKTVLVRGLNALAATICTPLARAGDRRRPGCAAGAPPPARGAASMRPRRSARRWRPGAPGPSWSRMDSAYYNAAGVHCAIRRRGVLLGHRPDGPGRKAAIAAIREDAWTPIRYPQAIWDDQLACWISDAEVAEVRYTAFTSPRNGRPVTARLIVRRVKDLSPGAAAGQGELFRAWRYHAVFTDSPFTMIQAEEHHRDHAVIEQVFADCNDGPLAHLPSGSFTANAAWLTLAAISHNLLRAAGTLASPATPAPAAPPCAATSSTSPPASPATAEATSPCTCPKAGTANRTGPACSKPPADRPPTRPDQPTGHRSPGPAPSPPPPRPGPKDKPQTGKRREQRRPPAATRTQPALRHRETITRNSHGGSRLSACSAWACAGGNPRSRQLPTARSQVPLVAPTGSWSRAVVA